MATEITLNDMEKYYLLRARQSGMMDAVIEEFESFYPAMVDECDFVHVYHLLFLWIEAKTEADKIWGSKGYAKSMLQAFGVFKP